MPKPLTPKQERFVQEYLVDLNATQAYIRAGYRARGHAAEVEASKLLRNPEVASRVQARREQLAEQAGMTAAEVLRELKLLGTSSVENYCFRNGWVDVVDGVPKEALRAVSSVKLKTYTSKDGDTTDEVEIRLWDKPGSLNLAGKHLGMFTDRQVQIDLSQLTDDQLRRIAEGEDPVKVARKK